MRYLNVKYLPYGYFVFAVSVAAFLLAAVAIFLDILPAIKGGYVLIGLALSGIIFMLGKESASAVDRGLSTSSRYYSKTVAALLLVSFPITVITGTRIPVVVLVLPVIYALLGFQLLQDYSSLSMLVQVIGVFFVGIATKYMDTYRYFGNGDLLIHTGYVDSLINSGSTRVLGEVYHFYPGLHIISGTLGLIGGLLSYDAIILLGISSSTAAVVIGYKFTHLVNKSRSFGVLVALGMVGIYQFQFYSVYVFPQTLATVLGYMLLYLSFRNKNSSEKWRFSIVALLIIPAMVVTHHFTFILFFPVFLFFSLSWLCSRGLKSRLASPRVVLLFTGAIAAVSYWIFNEHSFIGQLTYAVTTLLIKQDIVSSIPSSTQSPDPGQPSQTGLETTDTIGVSVSYQTISEAAQSLVTPEGIYFIFLLALFSLGLAELLTFDDKYKKTPMVFALGIFGSLLILKTPLELSNRLGYPFALFFAFVLAAGFSRLLSVSHWKTLSLFVLIILGTTAPIAAGDDMYRLHQGPDFYGSKNIPDPQREFTVNEYEGLRESSQFIRKNDAEVSSFWMNTVALTRFGVPISGRIHIADCTIKTSPNDLLYRTRWADHKVYYQGTSHELVISKERLKRIIAVSDKIFTTGMTGIVKPNRYSDFNSSCAP